MPPWPAFLVDYCYQFSWAEVDEVKTAEVKKW